MRLDSENVKRTPSACFGQKYSNIGVGRGAQNRSFGVKIQKCEFPGVQNEFIWIPHVFLNYFGAWGIDIN